MSMPIIVRVAANRGPSWLGSWIKTQNTSSSSSIRRRLSGSISSRRRRTFVSSISSSSSSSSSSKHSDDGTNCYNNNVENHKKQQQQQHSNNNKTSNQQDEKEEEFLVKQHYHQDTLWETIQNGLATRRSYATNDTATTTTTQQQQQQQQLRIEDLAPLDEFHSRGRQGTLDLCQLVQQATGGKLSSSSQCVSVVQRINLLDVGCGLGGTARHVAHTYPNTHVTGVDLVPVYVEIGNYLTQMGMGLQDNRVSLVQGSATALPFEDASFDGVLTVHVQMNIADKNAFYDEISRVLKPGGYLAFHDVLRGTALTQNDEPLYPCPWADSAVTSHLATEVELKQCMQRAGLVIQKWQDETNQTIAFFQSSVAKLEQRGLPPLGVHLLMGDSDNNQALVKMKNHLQNCQLGRTAVVMGVLIKKQVL